MNLKNEISNKKDTASVAWDKSTLIY